MIEIHDKKFIIDIPEVVNTVRSEVMLKRDKTILSDIKSSVNDLMVTCPVHSNGNESKPSCGINVNTGVFHCFTCGIRGGLDRFISYCFGYDDNGTFGFRWLEEHYSDSTYLTRQGLSLEKRREYSETKCITETELEQYRYYHEYMWKRRLTPEIVELFDVGYDPNFELVDKRTKQHYKIPCLTFPVDDITGKIVFVARRAIKGKLFHYPETANKPIYGLSKCLNEKVIYVCESIINALTLWSYGFHAVALLGTGSESQAEILKHCGFRKIVFCLDGDKAGDAGTKRMYNALKNITKLSYVKMPRDGRDINDLSEEEFLHLREVPLN